MSNVTATARDIVYGLSEYITWTCETFHLGVSGYQVSDWLITAGEIAHLGNLSMTFAILVCYDVVFVVQSERPLKFSPNEDSDHCLLCNHFTLFSLLLSFLCYHQHAVALS